MAKIRQRPMAETDQKFRATVRGKKDNRSRTCNWKDKAPQRLIAEESVLLIKEKKKANVGIETLKKHGDLIGLGLVRCSSCKLSFIFFFFLPAS